LLVSEPDNPCIRLHKTCASRYTSSTNVKAHIDHVRKMQYDSDDNEQSAPKRLRSSTSDVFNFKKHCLFCPSVSECLLASEYNVKIPLKHRKHVFEIRSTTTVGGCEYKQYILDICEKRNYVLGETVRRSVLSAVGDLHAGDARCHETCRAGFVSARNVQYSGRSSKSSTDLAFERVCKRMLEDRQKTWSSVELFAFFV